MSTRSAGPAIAASEAAIARKQRAIFITLAGHAGRERTGARLRIRRGFLVALGAGAAGSSATVLPLVSELP